MTHAARDVPDEPAGRRATFDLATEESGASVEFTIGMSGISILLLAAAAAFGPFMAWIGANVTTSLWVGTVTVVGAGAAGLVLRGFGELRQSVRLKAAGYFCGAAAYVVTASVGLTNAVHLLPALR